MSGHFLIGLISLAAVFLGSRGHDDGAPETSCIDLTPQHGGASQTGPSPFYITTPSNYTCGSPINVTLQTSTPKFKGYILTARRNDPGQDPNVNIGTFSSLTGAKQICSNQAVTHTEKSEKTSLTFQWTPPTSSVGSIVFKATFVQAELIYWIGVQSSVVTARACPVSNSTSSSSTDVLTTYRVTTPDRTSNAVSTFQDSATTRQALFALCIFYFFVKVIFVSVEI